MLRSKLKLLLFSTGIALLFFFNVMFGKKVDYAAELAKYKYHPALTMRLVAMGNDLDNYLVALNPKDENLKSTRLTWIIPAIVWKETKFGTSLVNKEGIGYGLFTTRYDSISWIFVHNLHVEEGTNIRDAYPHKQFVHDITNSYVDDITMSYVLFTNIINECYNRYRTNALVNNTIHKCIVALHKGGLKANLSELDPTYYKDVEARSNILQNYYHAIGETTLESTEWIKNDLKAFKEQCNKECIAQAIKDKYAKPIEGLPTHH